MAAQIAMDVLEGVKLTVRSAAQHLVLACLTKLIWAMRGIVANWPIDSGGRDEVVTASLLVSLVHLQEFFQCVPSNLLIPSIPCIQRIVSRLLPLPQH